MEKDLNMYDKYKPILVDVNENLWDDYTKFLDSSISYLKTKNDVHIDIKVAATFVVKQHYHADPNFDFNNIENLIDKFIYYYDKNYNKYITGFAQLTDRFSADLRFYYTFIKSKLD